MGIGVGDVVNFFAGGGEELVLGMVLEGLGAGLVVVGVDRGRL